MFDVFLSSNSFYHKPTKVCLRKFTPQLLRCFCYCWWYSFSNACVPRLEVKAYHIVQTKGIRYFFDSLQFLWYFRFPSHIFWGVTFCHQIVRQRNAWCCLHGAQDGENWEEDWEDEDPNDTFLNIKSQMVSMQHWRRSSPWLSSGWTVACVKMALPLTPSPLYTHRDWPSVVGARSVSRNRDLKRSFISTECLASSCVFFPLSPASRLDFTPKKWARGFINWPAGRGSVNFLFNAFIGQKVKFIKVYSHTA